MEFDGDVSGIQWDRTHAMDLTGDSMDYATSGDLSDEYGDITEIKRT